MAPKDESSDGVNLSRALFVVSSKSGTTSETMAAYAYFRGLVEAASSPRPGMQFVAITDPGRPLDKLATETGFRRTFLNPASIGGRFSALSFFGLVPAALIGVDKWQTWLFTRKHSLPFAETFMLDQSGDKAALETFCRQVGYPLIGRDLRQCIWFECHS